MFMNDFDRHQFKTKYRKFNITNELHFDDWDPKTVALILVRVHHSNWNGAADI